jgi:hypothetical protein
MTITVPHHARREWLTALAVGALILFTAVLSVGNAGAQEQTGDPAKWRTFWTQLYPVFTHPRCLNCHGVVNPTTGDNHGGGPVEGGQRCIECHTQNTVLVSGECNSEGFTATPDDGAGDPTFSQCAPSDQPGRIRIAAGPTWGGLGPDFVDGTGKAKDMRTICRLIKKEMAPPQLLHHMREDFLIGVAFEGTLALDATYEFAPDPPKMSRDAFAALLERWITEAAMACSTDGTLTLTDNLTLDSPRSPYGKTAIRNKIDASIFIKSEVATSELRYDETSTFVFTPVAPGCAPRSEGEAHFVAEGTPAARYEIQIGPGRKYRMRFLVDAVDGKADFSYVEQLCRPPSTGGESLEEPGTALRFGLDEWHTALPPPEHEPNLLILRGSTTIPNDDLNAFGFVSGGERTITWDIVIE